MAEQTSPVDIRILGPLEVVVDEQVRQINGAVRRSVLVLLALHPSQVLSTQWLVDAVWPEAAPATAVNTLRVHISQLRRALDASELIENVGIGYRLNLPPDRVDAYRFEALARAGRAQLGNGDTHAAITTLRSAMTLWRGPALVDVACEAASDDVQRWQQLQGEARVDLAAAELAHHGAAADVAELAALAAQRPFDERVWALLIKAEYWAGRQADALATYQRAATVLNDELGIEPGPGLRELQRQILNQDPALDPPMRHDVRLPAFPTSFVGRTDEVKAVTELVAEHRLVTLTGLGGVGKTRLAVAAAAAAANEGAVASGAVFASFERITDPALVAAPLADVLHTATPTVNDIVSAIGDRDLLVILDNCEHLREALADLAVTVLRACPAVTLLATSRVPLSVTGECVWAVPPLQTPPQKGTPSLVELLDHAAVELFIERVRQANPAVNLATASPDDLAEIAHLLAGVPLGIELAAAQCTVLTIGDVARRLRTTTQTAPAREQDRPQRHYSMEAALSGSLELLPPTARRLLVQMTVFHEPVELEAVEQVCADHHAGSVVNLLAQLVRAAALNVDLTGERATYSLLSPVRQAAPAAVAALGDAPPDLDRTLASHAAYFADLVRQADEAVGGPAEPAALARVDAALADVRAALEYTITHDPRLTLGMVAALGRYWFRRRLHTEGRRWAARALAADHPGDDRAARAAVLHVAGSLAFDDGDRDAAEHWLTQALEIWRTLDDPRALGRTLNNLAGIASDSGDHENAYRRWREVLEIFTAAGDAFGVTSTRTNLGIVAEKLHRLDDATTHLEAALVAARAIGNRGVEALVLERLAGVAARQGDPHRAQALSRAAHTVHVEVGTPEQRWRSHWNLAMRYRSVGELPRARPHVAAAAQGVLDESLFDAWWVVGLLQTAAALLAAAEPVRAARLLGLAEGHRKQYGHEPSKATIDDLDAVSQTVRDALGAARWQEEFILGEGHTVAAVLPDLVRELGED